MARLARLPRLADLVPRFMRGWPWVRQFYWQQWELDLARQRAKELAERLAE